MKLAFGKRPQVTRLRAERLLRTEIGYLYHRSFDCVQGERKAILRPPAVNPDVPHTRRAPRGADFYLARLYEVRLLTREEETYLFRKMNYLKFQADRLRQKLDPRKATVSQLDLIERLLAEAQTVRNQILEANLRLVFSLAKRYATVGSAAFDEFIGAGHVTLMQAVEKFDFARGAKFSTYATGALVNACNALVKRQKQAASRVICQFFDGNEDYVADHRATADQERGIQKLRRMVDQLLLGLSPRERRIIEARFGFNLGRSPPLKEIAQELGISKERVRQLQHRALDKLRALAERYHVEALP